MTIPAGRVCTVHAIEFYEGLVAYGVEHLALKRFTESEPHAKALRAASDQRMKDVVERRIKRLLEVA